MKTVSGVIISHQLVCTIQKLLLVPYVQWASSDRGKKQENPVQTAQYLFQGHDGGSEGRQQADFFTQ